MRHNTPLLPSLGKVLAARSNVGGTRTQADATLPTADYQAIGLRIAGLFPPPPSRAVPARSCGS